MRHCPRRGTVAQWVVDYPLRNAIARLLSATSNPPQPKFSEASPMPTHTTTLVERDARGRISLARVSPNLAERYLAREEPGGVIVLEPAVVMSEAQARLNAMPELHDQITESMRQPRKGVPHRPRRAPRSAAS